MDAATLALPFLFALIVVALAFDFLNGMNDAANSIATIVSTRVLRPQYAVAWASFFNFIAFLFFGLHVAQTLGTGIIDATIVDPRVVFGALTGAIVWNLITWLLGLPSSSSHALIGGLCGAALASSGGDFSVLKWRTGLLPKVVVPMISSPIAGFIFGALLMLFLLVVLQSFTPHLVQRIFGKAQLVSAAWMAHSHGTNDAQKTMGIIALALFTGTRSWAWAPSSGSARSNGGSSNASFVRGSSRCRSAGCWAMPSGEFARPSVTTNPPASAFSQLRLPGFPISEVGRSERSKSQKARRGIAGPLPFWPAWNRRQGWFYFPSSGEGFDGNGAADEKGRFCLPTSLCRMSRPFARNTISSAIFVA